MESLTLDYQDVERLLNRLDGQARLPTATHSIPLTHAEPPARTRPPTGRRLGVLALGIAIRRYRIDPQTREASARQAPVAIQTGHGPFDYVIEVEWLANVGPSDFEPA